MTPEVDAVAAWNQLLARVMDLALEGFYQERRVREATPNGVGFRAVLIADQVEKARVLQGDLTAFVKARAEAIRSESKPVQQVKR